MEIFNGICHEGGGGLVCHKRFFFKNISKILMLDMYFEIKMIFQALEAGGGAAKPLVDAEPKI